MKFGMYIMASEPISTAYFINPSHHFVCLYVCTHNVARQRLSRNVIAATNTHARIEELLNAVRVVLKEGRLLIPLHPCGGGFEYLHRDPASRRRRRKGKSQI
jgi:hypothetical protein